MLLKASCSLAKSLASANTSLVTDKTWCDLGRISFHGRTLLKLVRVKIKVGCSWSNQDKAWEELRAALTAVADEVDRRLKDKLRSKLFPLGTTAVEYSRLRATPGKPVLSAITESIKAADILVFDISPEIGHDQGKANVLFEAGLAAGLGRPYYVVSNIDHTLTRIPSDLLGLCTARLRNGRFETALRATLVAQCRKIWLRRNGLSE